MKSLILAVFSFLVALSYNEMGMAALPMRQPAQADVGQQPPVASPPPETAVPAQSPAPEAVEANPAAPSGEVTSEENSIAEDGSQNLWNHGSLMFDKKTSDWIHTAIKSHTKQIPLEILLPSLFPPEGKPVVEEKPIEKPKTEMIADIVNKIDTPQEAPAFYLKTILYFNHDNWSVWLNNKKITDKSVKEADDKASDISVVKVMRGEAVFFWQKTRVDQIYPRWKDDFISIDGEKYSSPDRNIVVDATTGNISFILKPNQSFVSKSLSIVEGRVSATSLTSQTSVPNNIPPGGAMGGNPAAIVTPPNSASAPIEGLDQKTAKDMKNYMDNLKNVEMLKSILDEKK